MIKYYQLTPDILLEYIYENDPKLNEDKIKGNTKDIYDDVKTMLLKSDTFSSKYLFFQNESEGLESLPNLVLPLNNSETQFVISKSTIKEQNFFDKRNISNIFSTKNGNRGYIYENTNYDKDVVESCDVKYDKCIVHFTSRNYFGNYDALIFQAYVYMNNKEKFYLSSFLFKKTSNLQMTSEQLLYNNKLYTTQIDFDIPSAFAIFNKDNEVFNGLLQSQNIELLKNTPVGINVYGVSGSIKGTDGYVRLKTLKINTISVPYIYNRLDEIHVNISEAIDGDFYYIDPEMGSDYISFVNYIENLGEDIRAYMVMHELSLKESWVDENGVPRSEITHKEYHIIEINEYDESEEISKKFDAKIKYRPICIKGGLNYMATIIDTIKIINTVDSSSYEITGSLDIANPYKYGLRFKKMDITRPIVNVYNKVSSNTDNTGVVVLNKSGGFVVENMSQNITSFIESTNIGVSIVELSPSDIN